MREIRMLRLMRRELETGPLGYRANSRPYQQLRLSTILAFIE